MDNSAKFERDLAHVCASAALGKECRTDLVSPNLPLDTIRVFDRHVRETYQDGARCTLLRLKRNAEQAGRPGMAAVYAHYVEGLNR